MAFSNEENQIIQFGLQNGKSSQEIKDAIFRFRTTGSPADPTKSVAVKSDFISDIKETGTALRSTIDRGVEKTAAIEQAQSMGEQGTFRSLMQKFGAGASTFARGVGDVALGIGKSLIPQGAEDAIASGAQRVAEPIMQSDPVQSVLSKYEQLKQTNPALARDIDSALGVGELALTVTGAGQTGRLAMQGARATREGLSATTRALTARTAPSFSIPQGTFASELIREIVPKASTLRERAVAKALGLSPVTDIATIKKATGNDIGEFMARNDLIKGTVEATEKSIDDFYRLNYNTVRDAVSLVDETYSFNDLPEMQNLIDTLIGDFTGKKSSEFTDALDRLNTIKSQGGFTLDQAQEIKSLFDQVESIYKRTGDVREALSAQDKANFINPVRRFIEDRVKENVGVDIRPLNNNVQTARAIADAIETRAGKVATAANLSLTDLNTLGFGTLVNPVVGVGALGVKKAISAPSSQLRLARFFSGKADDVRGMTRAQLKEIEDQIREELKKAAFDTSAE